MAVTLKDIAARVGKSVPTVSRALGGFEEVSAATRREVLRVAREMGYEPNAAARNLQKQRTDTIALILPAAGSLRLSDPFFGIFLCGVVEEAASQGFSVNISTGTAADETELYLKQIRSRRVDGFIVVRTQRQDRRIQILRENDVPFVAFGRVENDNDFHLVDVDDVRGMRLVVEHLVALGHRRLGFIAEPTTFTKAYHRLRGFCDGLQAHDLPYDPALVVETSFRQRSGLHGARQLLELPEPPTALVCCNDLLALGASSAVRERELLVGRDVSVTGFDDILLADYATPPLTTVHQPGYELGEMVAKMLLQLINGESVREKQVILQPSLVVRRSTAAPGQTRADSRF